MSLGGRSSSAYISAGSSPLCGFDTGYTLLMFTLIESLSCAGNESDVIAACESRSSCSFAYFSVGLVRDGTGNSVMGGADSVACEATVVVREILVSWTAFPKPSGRLSDMPHREPTNGVVENTR